MEFVGCNDTKFGVVIFPPELMADDCYVHRAWRLGNCFGDKDDARGGEKERDDDQNRYDGPGELDLIAAVNLRGFAVGILRAMAKSDEGVKEQTAHDEEDGEGNAQHQHGDGEDGFRGGSGGIEDIGGRLTEGRGREKARKKDCAQASIAQASTATASPTTDEERQHSATSRS